MAGTIIGETKREGQRKARRRIACKNQKKGRELASLVVGSYFTHNPSHVICMQIVRSNSNERSRISITPNTIFLFIVEAKGHLKIILTCCLKN
jgi:hypothetical protein